MMTIDTEDLLVRLNGQGGGHQPPGGWWNQLSPFPWAGGNQSPTLGLRDRLVFILLILLLASAVVWLITDSLSPKGFISSLCHRSPPQPSPTQTSRANVVINDPPVQPLLLLIIDQLDLIAISANQLALNQIQSLTNTCHVCISVRVEEDTDFKDALRASIKELKFLDEHKVLLISNYRSCLNLVRILKPMHVLGGSDIPEKTKEELKHFRGLKFEFEHVGGLSWIHDDDAYIHCFEKLLGGWNDKMLSRVSPSDLSMVSEEKSDD
eukprot:GHVH01011223.1.p1 GENE.GHVH01011223.1~~GHVH01011223.1.p1  ORF type:complete len:266 (-),score=45.75 GHVH01011223.1:549-1346(-)